MNLKYYHVALDVTNHSHGRNFGVRNSGFKIISEQDIENELVLKGESITIHAELNLKTLIHNWNFSQSRSSNLIWIYSDRDIEDADIFAFTDLFFKD